MRNLIVDAIREKSAQKRGGGFFRVEVDLGFLPRPNSDETTVTFLDLELAFQNLEAIDPKVAAVAQLKILGGLA